MDIGTIVVDRFRIEGRKAAGGMGEVHLATDLTTHRKVALKLLRWRSDALDARFSREASLLRELSHPGIVGYVAHGESADGKAYLAMDWIDGELLSHRLRRGPLSVADTLDLGIAVADALAVAHRRRIVHRDLKPGNLLCAGGEPRRTTILDFGLARDDAATLLGITRASELAGTPGYMAPEQARGLHGVDARADVYAFGCVLYECLSGKPAFTGDHVFAVLAKILVEELPRIAEVAPGVPPALDDLVMRMLAKDPRDRPADAAEVFAELQRLSSTAGHASAPATTLALGRDEQRVVCVILAAGDPMSERAPPSTAALAATATAHGGVLEPIAGGHLVVTFQAASTATDPAVRAARCALACAGVLPDAQLAIATGRGVAGASARVGTAIDAAAGLIARALADPTGPGSSVRIDDVTAGLLDSRFELGAAGGASLLLGYTESREADRTLLGRASPFVGRDRELNSLLAIIEECCGEPHAQAVLITGAAGAGKSRLRAELARRAIERDDAIRVWIGRGDPMSAGAPLSLLAQMIRREAGIHYGEEALAARPKLRARVSRHVPAAHAERVSQFLGEMTGVPFDDERRPDLRAARRDASVMGDQMRRAWEELLAAECTAAPLILVLEDLHWGDLPTVRFIDASLRALARQPLLVLALARPDVHELFPDLWSSRGLQIVPLRPLPERAARTLVEQSLGDRASDVAVRRIVEQAAGNPFYLEELIRAAATGQDQPGTVLAMIGARLEALPGEHRRLLRAGSILGESFWPAALETLMGRDPLWIANALEALVEQEWLVPRSESLRADETQYEFRHALVRDAAYAMLTDDDRTLGHRLAATWLENAGEVDAMTIGDHCERGGEHSRAVHWYALAAHQALCGTDLVEAIARARRGVARARATGNAADGDVILLREALAAAYCWRSSSPMEAEREGLAALDVLAAGTAAWCATVRQVVMAAFQLGHVERTVALAERMAASEVTAPASAAWIRTAVQIVRGFLFDGIRVDLADALLDRITAILPVAADANPGLPFHVHRVRGLRHIARGDVGAGLHEYRAARSGFEALVSAREACAAALDLGITLRFVGAWEESAHELGAVVATGAELGMDNFVAFALGQLAAVAAYLDRPAEAETLARRALDRFARTGDRRGEGAASEELALAMYARDLASAEAAARTAVELSLPSSGFRAARQALLAQILLAQGKAPEARACAAAAFAFLDTGGSCLYLEARIRLAWAEALRATADIAGAEAAIIAARDHLIERGAKIGDPAVRERFLTQIPDHVRTLALATAWISTGDNRT